MKDNSEFFEIRKYGRVAGIFYLVIIFAGLVSEFFIRSAVIVPGDARATALNLAGSETLFRLGILGDLLMVISDVVVGVLFYFMLRNTQKVLALMAAFFRLAQASVIALNLNNLIRAVLLVSGEPYLSEIGTSGLHAQVMLAIEAHAHGYILSTLMFAMSCMILGYLFIRSEYFPKILGILILAASAGYLFDVVVNIVVPGLADLSEIILVISAVFAELTLCVWLLVRGAKKPVIMS